MNITEKNRSLVFLGGTMLAGILIIGVLMLSESSDVESVEIVNEPVNTNFKTLENKIKNLKTQNFDPNSYNTVATDINSSYDQEFLTADQKTNLMLSLSTEYSNLVYAQAEFLLTGMDLHGSQEVTSWLNQLEKITAKNTRIDHYRNQIKWYEYYSATLSVEVNNFIRPGVTNYDESRYKLLMDKVQKMSNLDAVYKNKTKFSKIKNQLTLALQNFNADFYSLDGDL